MRAFTRRGYCTGQEISRDTTQEEGKSKVGLATVSMGWSELRNTLAEFVPAKAIHLNKRFLRLEQFDDHVRLHFTDGSSVDAKVVVGADGVFSKIRQQAVGDGLADFTVWRLRCSVQRCIVKLHCMMALLVVFGNNRWRWSSRLYGKGLLCSVQCQHHDVTVNSLFVTTALFCPFIVLTQSDHCSLNAVIGYQCRGPYIKIVLTSSVFTTRFY